MLSSMEPAPDWIHPTGPLRSQRGELFTNVSIKVLISFADFFFGAVIQLWTLATCHPQSWLLNSPNPNTGRAGGGGELLPPWGLQKPSSPPPFQNHRQTFTAFPATLEWSLASTVAALQSSQMTQNKSSRHQRVRPQTISKWKAKPWFSPHNNLNIRFLVHLGSLDSMESCRCVFLSDFLGGKG